MVGPKEMQKNESLPFNLCKVQNMQMMYIFRAASLAMLPAQQGNVNTFGQVWGGVMGKDVCAARHRPALVLKLGVDMRVCSMDGLYSPRAGHNILLYLYARTSVSAQ